MAEIPATLDDDMSTDGNLRGFVKVVHAFKPGDILVIESSRMLTETQYLRIRASLESAEKRLGVKFVVLEHPLKLAGAEVITTKEKI